jgi:hypothetical protein
MCHGEEYEAPQDFEDARMTATKRSIAVRRESPWNVKERNYTTSNAVAAPNERTPTSIQVPGVAGFIRATAARAANGKACQPVPGIALLRRLIYSSCPVAPPLFNSLPREPRSFTNFTSPSSRLPVRILPQSFFLGRIVLLLETLAAAVSLLDRPYSTICIYTVNWALTTAFTTLRCNYRHHYRIQNINTQYAPPSPHTDPDRSTFCIRY